VRIDFLVTGQFPGDEQEKPVAFPDPGSSSRGWKATPGHFALARPAASAPTR
jgi:hypothetical protein